MDFKNLTDDQLRSTLKNEYNFSCGPITASTRSLYIWKLSELIKNGVSKDTTNGIRKGKNAVLKDATNATRKVKNGVPKDATNATREVKNGVPKDATNATREVKNGVPKDTTNDTREVKNGFSKDAANYFPIYILTISMLIFLLFMEMYLVFFAFVLFASMYRLSFYLFNDTSYKEKEAQIYFTLINNSIIHLQSIHPDPIPSTHLRDSLLSPIQRHSPLYRKIWNDVVFFIEKYESRVQVSAINIDGEEFTTWKWISNFTNNYCEFES